MLNMVVGRLKVMSVAEIAGILANLDTETLERIKLALETVPQRRR